MKKIVLLLLLLASQNVLSQSFKWGEPFRISNETNATIDHYIVHNELHRFYSKYDLSIFNYTISTDQFSLNTLELLASEDISLPQPAMGLNMLTHLEHFPNSDESFTFFLYEIDRKTKENNLYFQNVDITTGARKEKQLVTKMQGLSTSNSGNWIINQSDNKAYFVVFKELAFTKKENEKIALTLLDKDKNVIKEITHTFSHLDTRNKQHDVFVSNNGNVYFIKNTKLKKQKPFKSIYVWKKDSDTVKEIALKQDDNYQLYQYHVTFDANDNLYFNSLFTHEDSKFFGMKIDMTGRHSGIHSNGLLSLKLDSNGEVIYQHRNNFSNIISNLSIKDFTFNNGTFWMLLDRLHVIEKSDNSSIATTGSPTYEYTYQSNGFLVGTINTETGVVNWSHQIDTAERDTRNDNADYLSYLHFFKGDNLIMMYNETRDLNKGIVHVPFLRRFPIKTGFSTDGKQLFNEVILNGGIGVKKEEYFELNTSMQLKMEDGSYIIRARSNNEYKYGYITL